MNLSFVAAFAALKVSFPGACPGKDEFITFLRMFVQTAFTMSYNTFMQYMQIFAVLYYIDVIDNMG